MNVFDDMNSFIQGFEKFSAGKLKEPEDIKSIISSCLTEEKNEKLNELAFTAKYVQGLFRVAAGSVNNSEIKNIDDIKKELSQNLEKCILLLKHLIAGETFQLSFEEKYLQLTHSSMSNLKNLINDFEWLKMYLNQLKRN